MKRSQPSCNALYARGIARLKSGDSDGGNADVTAAKAIQPDIDKVNAKA
jgi:hypothetical protein